jgi:Ubiquitin-like domain
LAQQQRDAKRELQAARNGHDSDDNIAGDVMDEQMKLMEESFFHEHPMLPLLLERHQTAAASGISGAAGVIVGRGVGGGVLADSIISVTLQSMTASSCEKPPLIRRLPLTLTILQVKTMLARHFGLDIDLQQLTFVAAATMATATTTTSEAAHGEEHNPTSLVRNTTPGLLPTIMDDDEATLGYFGVDDGAIIYMHEIDVVELELQQTREKEEFDSKLQQQQADWEARLGAEKKELI